MAVSGFMFKSGPVTVSILNSTPLRLSVTSTKSPAANPLGSATAICGQVPVRSGPGAVITTVGELVG